MSETFRALVFASVATLAFCVCSNVQAGSGAESVRALIEAVQSGNCLDECETVRALAAFDGDLIAGGTFIKAGGYDMAEVHVDLVGDAAGQGSVYSVPEGLVCNQWSCWGFFHPGSEVTLHAVTEDDYVAFTGWEGVDCPGLGSCTLIAEDWIALDARFDYMAEMYVGFVGVAAGQGSVYSVPEGLECDQWSCWGMFHPGSEVTLYAEVEDDYVAFTGWEGVDCPGLGSCTLIAEDWIALDARFDYMAEMYVGFVGVAAGQGSVSSVPEGLECNQWSCWGIFHPGSEVTLHAVTEDDYVAFTGWEGVDCPGLGSCTVIAEDWIALDARFDYMAEMYVGFVGVAAGQGSVYSVPEGLECNQWSCWGIFHPGSEVTLHAVTEDDYVAFTGWEGVDCPGLGSCTVIAEEWIALDARFEYMAEMYVDLVGNAADQGSVYSVPEGLECNQWSCWGIFHPGSEVTLHAEVDSEQVAFTGWDGVDCPGLGSCTLVADGHLGISASFEYLVELDLNIVGDGSGRVYSTSLGIDCPDGDCSAVLVPGTEITLVAEPEMPMHHFGGWMGVVGCSTESVCHFTIETDTTLTAEFLILPDEVYRDRFEVE